MSTLAVVEKILRETRRPMSVREIVETAGEALPTKSKTPDTVVARDLSMDIKKKGEASAFVRTAPGRYTMRELHVAPVAERETVAVVVDRPTDVLASAIKEDRAGPIAATRDAADVVHDAAAEQQR